MKRSTQVILTSISLLLLAAAIWWASTNLNNYYSRVANTAAIYITAAVSFNLINGIVGELSLGPNGFMALGGYTAAILLLPVAQKEMVYFLEPMVWPLGSFALPPQFFIVALLAAGLVAGVGAFIVGWPCLRLNGDYLAIATFGFGEIIIVLANNLLSVTNGALGIKGLPELTNLWWTWGTAVVTILVVKNLVNSSYGRAMRAIRDNEVAAEAMGINVTKTKMIAFVISGFFGGVSGALLTILISTISPTLFMFTMTFNLLIIIVLGGLGSITGSVLTAIIFTVLQELLRTVESPFSLGFIQWSGVPGMRMVVFSALLVVLMLYYRKGLCGSWEFSWEWLLRKLGRKEVDQWNQPMQDQY